MPTVLVDEELMGAQLVLCGCGAPDMSFAAPPVQLVEAIGRGDGGARVVCLAGGRG